MDSDWSNFDVESALDLVLGDSATRLQDVCENVFRLLSASGAAVALREGEQYVCRASCGEAPEIGTVVNLDTGVSAECIKQASTVIHNQQQGGVGSIIAAAVVCGDGVAGMIAAFASHSGAFTASHAKLLEGAAESLARTISLPRTQSASEAGHRISPDELEDALVGILALASEPPQPIVEQPQPELTDFLPDTPVEAVATPVSPPRAPEPHEQSPAAALVSTPHKTQGAARQSFPVPQFDTQVSQRGSRRTIWIALASMTVMLVLAAVLVFWGSRTTPAPPAAPSVTATGERAPVKASPEAANGAEAAVRPATEPVATKRAESQPEPSASMTEAAGTYGDAIPIAAGTTRMRSAPDTEPDAPRISMTAAASPALESFIPAQRSSLPKLAESPTAATPEPPRLIARVNPVYPAGLAVVHRNTPVVLTVTIKPDGRVASVSPKSGHPAMVGSAVAAVHRWRYDALPPGAPKINRTVELTIRFKAR